MSIKRGDWVVIMDEENKDMIGKIRRKGYKTEASATPTPAKRQLLSAALEPLPALLRLRSSSLRDGDRAAAPWHMGGLPIWLFTVYHVENNLCYFLSHNGFNFFRSRGVFCTFSE